MVEQATSSGATNGNGNSNSNGDASGNGGEDRPSSARRKQLREADAHAGTIPMVSNFFPLERYYEASDKVLESFESAFQKRGKEDSLDEAYVYGMRYCTFCVEGITQHDYYKQPKFAARLSQTNQRVAQVLTKLELVAEWMDTEEETKHAQRRAFIKRQRAERLRKQRALEAQRLQDLQQRIAKQKLKDDLGYSSLEQQQQQQQQQPQKSTAESALAKLQRLNQPIVPIPPPLLPPPLPSDETNNRKVSFQLGGENGNRDRPEPDGHYSSNDVASILMPPPILPPQDGNGSNVNGDDSQAPPSYNAIASSSYFGPGKSSSSSIRPPPTANHNEQQPTLPRYDALVSKQKQKSKTPKPPKQRPLSIRQYRSQAAKRHVDYQQQRLIQVGALRTYQGRATGSTNGCTVISACVVSKHLQSSGSGVTDSQIVSVVDSECIPLLKAIRNKLGLGGGSLIIPSDVHDHLVDHKWLYQHKFVGAAGGNILKPQHIGEVFQLLQGTPGDPKQKQAPTSHLKAGATLFFREHVISIVKFPTSPTEAVYDMVDSLPTCNGRASRTRCSSLAALKVQLEWYSSHKLSDSNCTYIERNRWDDNMADFDPRVFQAFVWANLPVPKP